MKFSFAPIKLFLRQYATTLIICGICFIAFAPVIWMATVFLLAIPLVPLMLLLKSFGLSSIVVMILLLSVAGGVILFLIIKQIIFKKKCSGKEFCIHVTLFCVTFFVAIPLTHLAVGYAEERELESLKEKIEIYKIQQGVFPTVLTDLDKSYQGKEYIHYELDQKHIPTLSYSSKILLLSWYSYDFQEHTWRERAD